MISKVLTSSLVFFSSLLFIFVSLSFSATLQVSKIGNLDLGGKMYSEWWYTGVTPIFYGQAAPNSEVTILIGTDTFKVTSDSSGAWSYSSVLASGDYDLSFSQGQEKVIFKLHLGQNLPANLTGGSQSTDTVTPVTGYDQLVSISLGVGVLLLATYFYIRGDPRRKSIFEAKILKED